ncbi:hypothetical protein AB3N59_18200 [Leptospira sp. WS92.C1]
MAPASCLLSARLSGPFFGNQEIHQSLWAPDAKKSEIRHSESPQQADFATAIQPIDDILSCVGKIPVHVNLAGKVFYEFSRIEKV